MTIRWGAVTRGCEICNVGLTKSIDECGRAICYMCRNQFPDKVDLLNAYIDALPPEPSVYRLRRLLHSMRTRRLRISSSFHGEGEHFTRNQLPPGSKYIMLREGQWKYLMRELEESLRGAGVDYKGESAESLARERDQLLSENHRLKMKINTMIANQTSGVPLSEIEDID